MGGAQYLCQSVYRNHSVGEQYLCQSVYRNHCVGAQYLCQSVYRNHCVGAQYLCQSVYINHCVGEQYLCQSVNRNHCVGAQYLCQSVYRNHCVGEQSLSVEHKTLLTRARSCRRRVWCIHGTGRNNVNSHSPRGMCRPRPTETHHDRLMNIVHTMMNMQFS